VNIADLASSYDRAVEEITRLRTVLAESQAREAALREAARALLVASRDTHDARETADGAFLTPAQDAERGLRRILADPSPAAEALLDKARRCNELPRQYAVRPNEESADTYRHPWHSPACYEGGAHRDRDLCTCGLTALEKRCDEAEAGRDEWLRGHVEPLTATHPDGTVTHGTAETPWPEVVRQRDAAVARAEKAEAEVVLERAVGLTLRGWARSERRRWLMDTRPVIVLVPVAPVGRREAVCTHGTATLPVYPPEHVEYGERVREHRMHVGLGLRAMALSAVERGAAGVSDREAFLRAMEEP
jgi:hypothetical protein